MIIRALPGFETVVAGAIALSVLLFAVGWMMREDPSTKPYLVIDGGGFIHNYRVADIYYGFSAHLARPAPRGSLIVASFENPSGGPDLLAEKRLSVRATKYGLRSPTLTNVEAGRPYRVSIRLVDRAREKVLFATERSYVSSVDSAAIPHKPLSVGPGYHRYRDGKPPCLVNSC